MVIEERKFSSMKTHDCHVILERLLTLAVHEFLPKKVYDALTELSNFSKNCVPKCYEWMIWIVMKPTLQ